MAKIGIYGGSFNPPHLGHILAAREFQRALDLDLVLFVPASTPPHKVLPPDSPDTGARAALLRLAVQELPFARVDDLELHRVGASYTVDTVRELRAKYPEDTLYLCMGTDMFRSFDSWYQPKKICSMATIVMAHREEIRSESVQFLSWEEPGAQGHVDILYDADGSANDELMAEIAAFIEKEIK